MPDPSVDVIVGVDTHTDTHTAVAIDLHGRRLDEVEIPATPVGYHRLLEWANTHGTIYAAGVEGTGSYGVGLARFLAAADVTVIEVSRPNRQHRRRYGKSDPADAEEQRALFCQVRRRVCRSRVTGSWSRSARCMW